MAALDRRPTELNDLGFPKGGFTIALNEKPPGPDGMDEIASWLIPMSRSSHFSAKAEAPANIKTRLPLSGTDKELAVGLPAAGLMVLLAPHTKSLTATIEITQSVARARVKS